MPDYWIIIALGGLFTLLVGRSAVIFLWPDSGLARFCEFELGFVDTSGDRDGDDGDSGGDGGGD